jgi:hypothetical protein
MTSTSTPSVSMSTSRSFGSWYPARVNAEFFSAAFIAAPATLAAPEPPAIRAPNAATASS